MALPGDSPRLLFSCREPSRPRPIEHARRTLMLGCREQSRFSDGDDPRLRRPAPPDSRSRPARRVEHRPDNRGLPAGVVGWAGYGTGVKCCRRRGRRLGELLYRRSRCRRCGPDRTEDRRPHGTLGKGRRRRAAILDRANHCRARGRYSCRLRHRAEVDHPRRPRDGRPHDSVFRRGRPRTRVRRSVRHGWRLRQPTFRGRPRAESNPLGRSGDG